MLETAIFDHTSMFSVSLHFNDYDTFTARCYAERCIAMASFCPSVCNADRYRLEFLKNNFTAISLP